MTTGLIVILLLALVALYSLAAAGVCIELNNGAHWWCPLCQLCGVVVRSIRRIL